MRAVSRPVYQRLTCLAPRRFASSSPVAAFDPEKPYPIWFFDPDGSAYHAALSVAKASSAVLENLHAFTGLPWWSTIAAGSLLIRLVFFPINCYSLRNASRFFDAKPDVQALQRSHRAALLALVGGRVPACVVGSFMCLRVAV